ncbi:glycosyltransferase [Vicingaceae bacterium]|nr:glycosyltransferase [Vicingaceae bacterium]
MTTQKKILVAPLNWGLGHATRCVPIIRELQRQKAEVIIGGDGMALAYLEVEFPELASISIPDLKIRYPKSGGFLLYFAIRITRLYSHVRKENAVLKKLVRQHNIDGIISDNRYGLYHAQKPSVLITHQLYIETPSFKRTVRGMVRKLIAKFSICWVPDIAGSDNLSGRLSHSERLIPKTEFISLLSRFSAPKKEKEIQRRALAVLSGPEPYRSQLEAILIKELRKLKCNALIVRGVITEKNKRIKISNQLEIVDYLTTDELRAESEKSEFILSRSGYSSIMDLVAMHQKALLIPTPGQNEQEYLAQHLNSHPLFVFSSQDKLNLANAFLELENLPKITLTELPNQKEPIQAFLKMC